MRYPLKARYCPTDDYRAFMTKGHHPLDAFLKDCEREYGGPLSDVWNEPRHVWWRFVPASPAIESGYSGFYHEAVPHSQGAFPVTVMDDA